MKGNVADPAEKHEGKFQNDGVDPKVNFFDGLG